MVDYLIPDSQVGFLIAAGSAWYGKRVALTYAPGYLANVCIQSTINTWGPSTGKIFGTTIVAPVIVPTATPFAAWATAVAFWHIAAIVCNIFHQIIGMIGQRWSSDPPPDQELKTVAKTT